MRPVICVNIDLERGVISRQESVFSERSLPERLGGFGRAVYFIKDHVTANPHLMRSPDPGFDPDNAVSIDLGLLTGSNLATSLRTVITALSPLKTSAKGGAGIFYSTASADFGRFLQSQGIDSIRLFGQSSKPSMIHIATGSISLIPADPLIGKTTLDKIGILNEMFPHAAFAVIGPVGERKFRTASVAFSTMDQVSHGSGNMRFAGRGGMGGVLGSKNILAIAVDKGEAQYKLDNVLEVNKYIASNPKSMKYRVDGTFQGNIVSAEELGVAIHDNFTKTTDPRTGVLFRHALSLKGYAVENKACFGCPVKCWKEIIGPDKKTLGKIDYETGSLLGPNLGIYDIDVIMELIQFADAQGLDAISFGVALGCALEQAKRLGDVDYVRSLCRAIQDGSGDVFGLGVVRMCGYSHAGAMHVKGIEFPAYPGFFNPGYAFAVAGPHMSMDTYNRAWQIDATNSVEEWTRNILRGPLIMLYDMIGVCKFAKLTFEQVAALYNSATRENVTVSELKDAVLTVYFQAREIDKKMGFTEEDDVLPRRCFEEHQSTIQRFLTPEFFFELKKKVYAGFEEKKALLGINS